MPGRSDNEIKNHWHTSLKKRLSIQETSKKKSPNNVTQKSDDEDQNISPNQSCTEVSSCATIDQNLENIMDGQCEVF